MSINSKKFTKLNKREFALRNAFVINDPSEMFATTSDLVNVECNNVASFYLGFGDSISDFCVFCPQSSHHNWDNINLHCGLYGTYWIGSAEEGFCADCQSNVFTNRVNYSPTCYCNCNTGYDEVDYYDFYLNI